MWRSTLVERHMVTAVIVGDNLKSRPWSWTGFAVISDEEPRLESGERVLHV